MSDPSIVNIDIKNNHISDNRGNSINNRNIQCDGLPMKINEQRVLEQVSQFSSTVQENLKAISPTPNNSEYDWKAPITPGNNPFSQVPNIQQALETAQAVGKTLQENVSNITITMNPGVESPLTALCNTGRSTGMLER